LGSAGCVGLGANVSVGSGDGSVGWGAIVRMILGWIVGCGAGATVPPSAHALEASPVVPRTAAVVAISRALVAERFIVVSRGCSPDPMSGF
jgi:hypothetical protein